MKGRESERGVEIARDNFSERFLTFVIKPSITRIIYNTSPYSNTGVASKLLKLPNTLDILWRTRLYFSKQRRGLDPGILSPIRLSIKGGD